MVSRAEVIPNGDEGTYTVVERMAELVRARIAHPTVRGVAVHLARQAPAHHLSGQIAAVRHFLERRVPFLADPSGVELLHDPVVLLEDIQRYGTARADCDDVAVLGAALGGALGLSARFVVVGFRGPNEPFEHVWTELHDGRAWHELDVTRPRQGAEAPAVTREYVVNVVTGEVPPMQRYPLAPSRRLGYDPGTMASVTRFAAVMQPWHGLDGYSGSYGPDGITAGTNGFSVTIPTGGTSAKDAERKAATDAAYQSAITGNPIALLFLKQRTGQYGIITIPGYGEVGGWATSWAKSYAAQMYSQALAKLNQVPGGTPALPPHETGPTPGESPGAPVSQAGLGSGGQLALLVVGAIVVTSLLGSRGRQSR